MKDRGLASMTESQYQRQTVCKCGGAMHKVSCFTKQCLAYECRVCGRRGHHAPKPADCTAAYG